MNDHERLEVTVGVDGSPSSLEAVKWAAAEAAERGGTLRIIHAVPVPDHACPDPGWIAPSCGWDHHMSWEGPLSLVLRASRADAGCMTTEPAIVMTQGECWALAREAVVGRLAVIIDDRPEVFPVNFLVDHGSVVFRTAAGVKLSAAVNQPVAFEIDGYDPTTGEAWSVVIKGTGREVKELDEVLDALQLPLDTWHAAPKPRIVRIEADAVTGRRFHRASPAANLDHAQGAAGVAVPSPQANGSRPPRAFVHGVRDAGLPSPDDPSQLVRRRDLACLPQLAQHFLRVMGVEAGQPRTWSFVAHLTGRFRRSEHEAWMPADAWQYNSGLEVARLFWMRLKFAGRLPMIGWDTYRLGHGRMRGKLLGLVTVADGKGPPFDISELTTYLNDAVLMAPGMLLNLPATWTEMDDHTLRISLSDQGRTVSADVTLDVDGLPVNFTTMDRFMDRPGGPVRTRWGTPMNGWQTVAGHRVITEAAAEWHVPGGPLRYAELTLCSIRFDVPPARPWN